ncbi:autotransporter domain-containing protein [Brucella sp. 21LCYQ03]|nr:autotransporter domain-containing protein [Brucella sp. 21LCYQ03]
MEQALTYAQTGQIKSAAGQVLNINPNVVTTQSNSNGFGLYATDGGIIYSGPGSVSTAGSNAAGLFAAEPGSIIYWQGTDITTSGFRGRGIDTVRGGQVIGYGTITTNGERAHAIQAGDTNATAGPTKVTLLPGTSVHTFGNGSYGLHAYATGTISGSANIITEGVSSFGAHAEKDSSVTINNSTIETHGMNAIGLLANTDAIMPGVNYTPGQLTATSTTVKTTANNAFGAFADVEASITLVDITIDTWGEGAVGLFANRAGRINSQGDVSTEGNYAHGVAAGLIAVQGATDSVKHSGSILTKGNSAYGAFAQNAAQLDISGAIETRGQLSHGALIDAAELTMTNLGVTTAGDGVYGLYAQNGANITGQANITTQGEGAHGVMLETGSAVVLDSTDITTYGAFADGASVKNSSLILSNSRIETHGRGLKVTDSSTITLINTTVESDLSTVEASFTDDNGQISLNIDGTSSLSSGNGVFLAVKRDNVQAQTGSVTLSIADDSTVAGDIVDTDTKTSGYTDVSLGANVTWTGRALGVRHFKSIDSNSQIKFEEGSVLHGDIHSVRSNLNFHETGVSIAGDMLLHDYSNANGGSGNGIIMIAGNVLIDETSSQSGSWAIGGNLENRGLIAPGPSAGTVTVGGDFNALDTSVYEVEINAAGQNDRIVVAGTASLAGRVSLLTTGGSSGFVVNHRYTILSAEGGLNGTTYNGGLSWNNASSFLYVSPQLSYDAQNAYLTFARNDVPIVNPGQTPNEQAVGGAIGGGGLPDPLETALLLQANEKAVKSLLSRLSGEAHQSVLSALQQNSSRTRDTITDRLREAFAEDGPTVWSRVINARTSSDTNSNYHGLRQRSNSLFLGADTMITEDIRGGIMGGIEKTNFNFDALGSASDSDSYHLGAYGSWQQQAIRLRIGGAYSWHNISLNRSFPIFENLQQLDSEYKAYTIQIFGETGYKFNWQPIDVEPFVGLAYVRTRRDSFIEQARNSLFLAELDADRASMNNTVSTLGIRVGHEWALANAIRIEATATPAWRHAFGDLEPYSSFALNHNTAFEISGLPISRDIFSIDTAVNVSFHEQFDINLSYSGQFGREVTENAFKGLVRFKF